MDEEWRHDLYQSGTQVVINTIKPKSPYLYVYGPNTSDENNDSKDRYGMCKQLKEFLNGGPRPSWLDDLTRISETVLIGVDGSRVTATGPLVDIDPPNLKWCQDNSEEAKDSRARLIDMIINPARGHLDNGRTTHKTN